MVVLNSGLTRYAQLVNEDITDGLAGTSGTSIATTVTEARSPVVSTETDLIKSQSERTINTSFSLDSSTANGETLREWAVRMNSDATTLSLTLTAGVTKSSNNEVTRRTTLGFSRP